MDINHINTLNTRNRNFINLKITSAAYVLLSLADYLHSPNIDQRLLLLDQPDLGPDGFQRVSEYDQEIPQSHTADQPTKSS